MSLFNQPWMDALAPALLRRYWERKGRPGVLHTTLAGGLPVVIIPGRIGDLIVAR